MPIMDGFKATHKIKEYYKSSNMFIGGGLFSNEEEESSLKSDPIVIALSSALLDNKLINDCKEAGFDNWLSSPLSTKQLQHDVIDAIIMKRNLS